MGVVVLSRDVSPSEAVQTAVSTGNKFFLTVNKWHRLCPGMHQRLWDVFHVWFRIVRGLFLRIRPSLRTNRKVDVEGTKLMCMIAESNSKQFSGQEGRWIEPVFSGRITLEVPSTHCLAFATITSVLCEPRSPRRSL